MTSQAERVETQLLVSYRGMQQSALLLNDLAAHYFPLYGLSEADFFTYYPVLGFVEALYYQAREEAEATPSALLTCSHSWAEQQKHILQLLTEHELAHPMINTQLKEIGDYLDLIQQIKASGAGTHAEVVRTAELGMADVRLLHVILLLLLNKTIDKPHFDILWALEVWGEIDWNMTEYDNDIAAGRYSIYQMFVRLYGEDALSRLKTELDRYWSLFQDRLASVPKEEQQVYHDFLARYQPVIEARD